MNLPIFQQKKSKETIVETFPNIRAQVDSMDSECFLIGPSY